jgi:hypothetical protein
MTGDQYKDHFIKQLNKWDTDLSRMTKNYKMLKADDSDVKRFLMLKRAFVVFSNNFEKWVYRNILDNRNSKGESYHQKEVRSTAWSFLSVIGDFSLFPESYDYKSEKHIPAPHLLDSTYRGNSRKQNIIRYQREWRKFKEAFTDLVQYEAEKIDEVQPDETINVDKINILIKNKDKDWSGKYIKSFMSHVRKAVQAINKAGLSKSIKDLHIELNFNPTDVSGLPAGLTAGAYRKEDDTLYILPLGLKSKLSDSTLIHEIGHRYWFKHVPARAKKAWEDKINSQMITVKKEHIEKFFDEYYDEKWGFPYRREFEKKVEKITDPTLKIIFSYLGKHTPVFKVEDGKDERQVYMEFMMEHNKGEQVPLEWITDYGRTNPSEAFAEAFKLWVGGVKGKLGPWTRAFFKEIVSTGGANIREEKNLIDKYLVEETLIISDKEGEIGKRKLKFTKKNIEKIADEYDAKVKNIDTNIQHANLLDYHGRMLFIDVKMGRVPKRIKDKMKRK